MARGTIISREIELKLKIEAEHKHDESASTDLDLTEKGNFEYLTGGMVYSDIRN